MHDERPDVATTHSASDAEGRSTLAIIPARGGSKRIPHKNIMSFMGKPMLAHSIDHAMNANLVDRVIVSTDSEDYAEIARSHGAEVPFLRPAEFAGDLSTDLQVFTHALTWCDENEGYRPDICVHLRPTYPIRPPGVVDEAIEMLRSDPTLDSVRTIAPAPETPYKMWKCDDDGMLSPCLTNGPEDAWNMPTQDLPEVWLQNACVDVARTKVILDQKSMTGRRIRGLKMDDNYDLDTVDDLLRLGQRQLPDLRGKRLVVDIDGVIANLSPENDYTRATANEEVVRFVNALASAGSEIVLFTARGSATGIDWQQETEEQMRQWGVRFDHLLFEKPHADYYIDDRAMTLEEFLKAAQRATEDKQ